MKLLDVLTSPWAIIPDKLLEIQALYFTHLRGEKLDIRAIESQMGRPLQNESKPYQVENGVAIIPIEGIVAKKMNLFTRISGGTSTQLVKKDFEQAMADPEVSAILLDVDSPGGTVDGTEELAEAIYEARLEGLKPIVAYTDGLMASAAYWIGSAADAVYISGDTPWVGSIGVVTAHIDYSKWEEKEGIKTTEVFAGKYKRIDSEYAPLSKEGAQYLQDQVDHIYSIFSNTVSRNRDLAIEDVANWADGRLFIGKQAIFAGLVDGVSTFDRLVALLGTAGQYSALRASVYQNIMKKGGKKMELTVEVFKSAYPELHAEIEKAGFDKGYEKGLTEGHAREKLETARRENTAAAAPSYVGIPVREEELPFEERVKAHWDKHPETRAEFAGNYENYAAYKAAEEKGLVKIYKGKGGN